MCYSKNMNFNLNQNLKPEKWDQFVAANSLDGGFLQSAGWGDFQVESGRTNYRLAVESAGQIIAVALIVKHRLPLGFSYLYCPRGPVVNKELVMELQGTPTVIPAQAGIQEDEIVTEALKFLFTEVKKIAQAEKAFFLRLDPAWTNSEQLQKNKLRQIGEVQPQQTLILDLNLSEAELLKRMKPKTRYNIKVGERHGIFAEVSQNPQADFAEFWDLMEKTATRDRIKTHQRGYYLKMLKVPGVKLVFARSENLASGKALAANIMVFWGEWCIYLHGASDYEFRDKMAPYALQWEMIKAAKKQGCKFYDFWGANEARWPGVTRFKIGFAPDSPLVKYVGAYDLVFNKILYSGYWLMKKF